MYAPAHHPVERRNEGKDPRAWAVRWSVAEPPRGLRRAALRTTDPQFHHGDTATRRQTGTLARALLDHQEQWCRAAGYQKIEVRTANRFRGMLLMLIQAGYGINGIDFLGRIALCKRLG